jgi:hypothetical protein
MLRKFYPQGNGPWYSLGKRLGGTQIGSGCGGEEKNSQTLPGLEPPIIQHVFFLILLTLILKVNLKLFCV